MNTQLRITLLMIISVLIISPLRGYTAEIIEGVSSEKKEQQVKELEDTPPPKVIAKINSENPQQGYLEVSWQPVENAMGYQVVLYNGIKNSYWDVPKGELTWTTKGKGMFPTEKQLSEGEVNFLRNQSGEDFAINPSVLYEAVHRKTGENALLGSEEYVVRLVAITEEGTRPISSAVKLSMDSNHVMRNESQKINSQWPISIIQYILMVPTWILVFIIFIWCLMIVLFGTVRNKYREAKVAMISILSCPIFLLVNEISKPHDIVSWKFFINQILDGSVWAVGGVLTLLVIITSPVTFLLLFLKRRRKNVG